MRVGVHPFDDLLVAVAQRSHLVAQNVEVAEDRLYR